MPFTHTSLQGKVQLTEYPVEHIRHLIEISDNQTDYPTSYAILPGTYSSGQVYKVLWYPTPDAAYTLNYSYDITPSALSGAGASVIGGDIHGPTIKALARAEAEAQKHDGETAWQIRADRMMMASIELDKRNKPSNIGSYYHKQTIVPLVRSTVTMS